MFQDIWRASEDADVVLTWVPGATSLAERLNVPVFVVGLTPALHLPTAAFSNPFQPSSSREAHQHRRSWRLALPTLQIGQQPLDHWRTQTLGLDPLPWRRQVRELRRLPHLLGFSTAVVPRPDDWAPWIHEPGFWFLDQRGPFEPPADLARFLEAGDPPIVIGFSSQVSGNAAEMTRAVIDGVTQSGTRAIIVAGFGGLGSATLPPHMMSVSQVPYDWLFPRISGVVHQGGAGSTSAAMRAGVPNMAVTFGFDQGFWGERIDALGVGPAPIAANALTAKGLATALRTIMTDRSMRTRARALADALRQEDGVAAAVAIVLAELERRPRRPVEA
jgi:UDP:flavonoid glycosyltransferase YjiC (YdhE family)